MSNIISGNIYELGLTFRPGQSRKLLYEPVKRFLNDHSYDVVHVHSGSISVLAYVAKAARSAGINKVIVHSHATGIPSIKHKAIRFLFGFMLRTNATDFLACSIEAGKMKFPHDIVKHKLVVIKNGINIANFRFCSSKRKMIRKTLGIAEDTFVLGHVGRFSKEKNHNFLIEVFDKVHEQIPNSKLLLVGAGELANDIRAKVKELGLKESVIFTGNVDNVQDYYQAMNVFLLPSIYEGLSFVTLEAQATGIPCVISTGVPEAAKIAKNVYRMDLADKQGWINNVINLKNEHPLDNSVAIHQAGYDIKDTSKQIRTLYFQDLAHNVIDISERPETDTKHENVREGSVMRVLEITGEPILHGGQEKFIQNLIENIDHTDLVIDVLTPYYCQNKAFMQTIQSAGLAIR